MMIKRRFETPIAHTSGEGNSIELKLPGKQPVNHVIIQEDIEKGERIREYMLQARIKGKWQTIAEGSCVGHKRIQTFDEVET